MTTFETIYETIHDMIVDATGLDSKSVRPAFADAPIKVPKDRNEAFVVVNFISVAPVGHDVALYKNQTGTYTDDNDTPEDESDDLEFPYVDLIETVHSDTIVTASIKVMGLNAESIAQKIKMAPTSFAGISILNTGNIGFIRAGNIQNISQIQNGGIENRRNIDLEFNVPFSCESIVNAIDSATITGDFYGSGKITKTIEVTNE
jgi:hypothetical protein